MTEPVLEITSSEVEEWNKIIGRTCLQVSRDYNDVDLEDLEQSVWLALLQLQRRGKLQSPQHESAFVTLRSAARKAAAIQRREQLTISAQYAYRTSDIRRLYEDFFDHEQWLGCHVPEDAVSELGPVELELMGDISRAFNRLPKHYRALLFRNYVLKEELGSAERKRLSAALARTADILNTYQPKKHLPDGPGRRQSISNRHAKFIIDVINDGGHYRENQS